MSEHIPLPSSKKERPYFNKEAVVSGLVELLRLRYFEFAYRERNAAALAAIKESPLKQKLKEKREEAVELILQELEKLEERKQLPPNFFKSLSQKTALAAEVIERLATSKK